MQCKDLQVQVHKNRQCYLSIALTQDPISDSYGTVQALHKYVIASKYISCLKEHSFHFFK